MEKMEKKVVVTLNMEKTCNNVVKFVEPVGKFAPYKIGNIYINKVILAENNYDGKPITISIGKANKETNTDDTIVMMPEIPEDGGRPTNSIKFNEVLPNEFVPAIIGKLTLSKFVLAEIDYYGEPITVDVEFE